MNTITLLRKAGARCEFEGRQYGIDLVWSITAIGLKLIGTRGTDSCVKYVTWTDLADTGADDLLMMAESKCLQGLSA